MYPLGSSSYYENHRTVEWAQIFISSPHPLFAAAPPIFVEELSWYVSWMAHILSPFHISVIFVVVFVSPEDSLDGQGISQHAEMLF